MYNKVLNDNKAQLNNEARINNVTEIIAWYEETHPDAIYETNKYKKELSQLKGKI